MAAGDGWPGLPAFQLEVARVFFALPASKGFLLGGGSSPARAAPDGAPYRGP